MELKIKRKPLIAIFAGLGVFFLSIAVYLNLKSGSKTSYGFKVGSIEHISGQGVLIRTGKEKKIKVTKSEDLNHQDSFESEEGSQFTLIFENGFVVKTLPQTILNVERIDDPENLSVVIQLKRGDLQIEKMGRENSLFILKNGTQVSAHLYNDSEIKQEKFNKAIDDFSSTADSANSLTEEEISLTLSSFKSSFSKCFSVIVQKDPKAKGEANLTFTIENNGHPSFFEVTSTFNDSEFKNCLKGVMERIVFKPFQGPPISTVFPLKFE